MSEIDLKQLSEQWKNTEENRREKFYDEQLFPASSSQYSYRKSDYFLTFIQIIP